MIDTETESINHFKMKKMKKKWKTFALVAAVAAVGGYGVYTNQQAAAMSDLMLENIEALAKIEDPEEGGVIVTCSKNCDDGIGRCWILSNSGHCAFTGYQDDSCTC